MPSGYIDGCKNLATGSSCPIKKGESYLWKHELKVPKLPLAKVNLEVTLLDDSNNAIFCFKIECKLTRK